MELMVPILHPLGLYLKDSEFNENKWAKKV